eukprot:Em0015g184a
MSRSQAILLVLILKFKCEAQDLCDGNYMTIERIRAGNDVALVCDCPFGATPVAWFKDNNETATFTGSDIYTVHVLSADDGGYYSCRCNAHSKCFLLKVHSQITHCQVLPTIAPTGGTITIQCGAEGYPPPNTCYVIVPGLNKQLDIPLNGSFGTVTYSNVTLNNSGIFTCFVNDFDSGYDQQLVSINTYEQPKILQFNYTIMQKSAVLTCYISYNSNPYSIILLHNNTTIYANSTITEHPQENSSTIDTKYIIQVSEQMSEIVKYTLTIGNFSPADISQYTCQVGSLYRSMEQQSAINVTAFFPNDTPATPFTTTTAGGNGTSNTPTTAIIAAIAAVSVTICILACVIAIPIIVFKKAQKHASKEAKVRS